ncbi:MAG: PIN domain-containing protein [Candidatus Hydrothermarchaeaceae archaeon]
MKKTASRYFIDSSAWLSYFYGESWRAKNVVESTAVLFTSVLSLFEVKRKMLRGKGSAKNVEAATNFIKERSIIFDLNEAQAEKAARISIENRLHTMDALIYTGATDSNAVLLTCDSDFHDLENVEII